jgi:hypothetical protein
MGDLIRRSCLLLREVTGCQKGYIAPYTEAPHLSDLHVHVIPRVFGLLTAEGVVPPDEVRALSEELRARFPA